MNLHADKEGEGFGTAAEAAEDIFTRDILPMCPRMQGFVNVQRLVDHHLGVFKILSLWETEEDCIASGQNSEYYGAGIVELRACARFGMFKTEHFKVWRLQPDGDSTITTPYARTTVMELNDKGNPDKGNMLKDADAILENLGVSLRRQPGFCGLMRLLGTGEAEGTYMMVSYWDSHGALTSRSFAWAPDLCAVQDEAVLSDAASAFRKCIKPGTDVKTQQYEHMCFRHPRRAVPLLEPGTSSAATFQLACISFGVGIFVMPSVFQTMSLLLGSLVLVGCAICSNFCMQLMLRTATLTGAATYEDVMGNAFGSFGRTLALVSLAISTLTANCAHMQFVGNMWIEMMGSGGGIMNTLVGPDDRTQQFAAKLIFGTMALPLCFKRQLNELRFVSLATVIFCFSASIVVCINCLQLVASDGAHGEVFEVPSPSVLLQTTPNIAFGFSSIVELFHVRAEMKRPEAMSRCAHVATALVCSLYLAVGLVGALAFSKPGSNLLENFPTNHFVSMLRLGIIVMITLLYPIINFPCVQALLALRGRFTAPSMRSWRITSVLCLIFVLLIDTTVNNLGDLFGLCGSLGLGLVAYVLPCSAGLAVTYRQQRDARLPVAIVASASVVLVLGLLMTVGSTALIIVSVVKGQ